jgi:hypothetical protein
MKVCNMCSEDIVPTYRKINMVYNNGSRMAFRIMNHIQEIMIRPITDLYFNYFQ